MGASQTKLLRSIGPEIHSSLFANTAPLLQPTASTPPPLPSAYTAQPHKTPRPAKRRGAARRSIDNIDSISSSGGGGGGGVHSSIVSSDEVVLHHCLAFLVLPSRPLGLDRRVQAHPYGKVEESDLVGVVYSRVSPATRHTWKRAPTQALPQIMTGILLGHEPLGIHHPDDSVFLPVEPDLAQPFDVVVRGVEDEDDTSGLTLLDRLGDFVAGAEAHHGFQVLKLLVTGRWTHWSTASMIRGKLAAARTSSRFAENGNRRSFSFAENGNKNSSSFEENGCHCNCRRDADTPRPW
ncbi:uncharacterized protein J3D65DRAFT_427145 [Phyllosticta citribraziliensis]|uniref:Uncharacterized protein n=1 Tax=Phyllosticta citribraziliensis TaxID=989973 RepID=A0ABR1LI58_9PEZI